MYITFGMLCLNYSIYFVGSSPEGRRVGPLLGLQHRLGEGLRGDDMRNACVSYVVYISCYTYVLFMLLLVDVLFWR